MAPDKNIQAESAALNTRWANDKYRAILNSIDEGFCLIEIILNEAGKPVDLVYLETNRIFQQQTGLGDVVGRRLCEIMPGEQVWIDFYGNVALTGEPARMEYYVEAVGRWFSAYASHVGGENNLQVAVVFDDITDRKLRERRQEYLLQLNDSLRSLTDADEIEATVARIAMDYFNADRCYYCKIEGSDAVIRHAAARGDLPSVTGTYPLGSFAIFKKVIDEGKPFIVYDSHTTDIMDEPLRALCIQLQVISFIDVPVIKNGNAVGVLCIVQSTPRKWNEAEIELAAETAERVWSAVERARAEAALRKNEALLASVFEVLPVGLGVIDKQGKFLLMNEEMHRFIPGGKIPTSDDENYHRWIVYSADGTLLERQNFPGERALRGDPIPNLEMIYEQEDGQQVWTRVASMPFKNENDEIIGVVTVITDIDELKRTESELIKNERQLKALLKLKDDFIGVASHELKTPVTTIKAYAGIVQDMLDEAGLEEESDIMNRLNKQIDRLTLLISDLLDTTKMSEGKISYSFEPTDINQLLKERIEELGRTTTRNLHLHLQELPLVMADKERIGQVIVNLLTNAIKYSQRESMIIVKTVHVPNGIQVSVQDEGYGISEKDQLKIFDRFYRVTANNLDTYPGMGLGLYISAQIVERHGGRLEVNSTPGKGSVFFFTLPYAQGAAIQ